MDSEFFLVCSRQIPLIYNTFFGFGFLAILIDFEVAKILLYDEVEGEWVAFG